MSIALPILLLVLAAGEIYFLRHDLKSLRKPADYWWQRTQQESKRADEWREIAIGFAWHRSDTETIRQRFTVKMEEEAEEADR